MGQEVSRAVLADPELRFVGAVEGSTAQSYLPVPEYPDLIPLSSSLGDLIEKTCPDVVVDFTRASVAMEAARIALPLKVAMVIGATGLSDADLDELRGLCDTHGVGAVVAPNFSLGAVLLMHLAQIASRFFSNAEIIEMHHDRKLDAPSGTALMTARLMCEARGSQFTCPPTEKEVLRGCEGWRGEWAGDTQHQDAGNYGDSGSALRRKRTDLAHSTRCHQSRIVYAGSHSGSEAGGEDWRTCCRS
jgi:4-hydroxy-tetrahydrodipicolinate reductase